MEKFQYALDFLGNHLEIDINHPTFMQIIQDLYNLKVGTFVYVFEKIGQLTFHYTGTVTFKDENGFTVKNVDEWVNFDFDLLNQNQSQILVIT